MQNTQHSSLRSGKSLLYAWREHQWSIVYRVSPYFQVLLHHWLKNNSQLKRRRCRTIVHHTGQWSFRYSQQTTTHSTAFWTRTKTVSLLAFLRFGVEQGWENIEFQNAQAVLADRRSLVHALVLRVSSKTALFVEAGVRQEWVSRYREVPVHSAPSTSRTRVG